MGTFEQNQIPFRQLDIFDQKSVLFRFFLQFSMKFAFFEVKINIFEVGFDFWMGISHFSMKKVIFGLHIFCRWVGRFTNFTTKNAIFTQIIYSFTEKHYFRPKIGRFLLSVSFFSRKIDIFSVVKFDVICKTNKSRVRGLDPNNVHWKVIHL